MQRDRGGPCPRRAGLVKGLAERRKQSRPCTRDRRGHTGQERISDSYCLSCGAPTYTPHPTHRTYNARRYREDGSGSLHMVVRIAMYSSRWRRSGLGRKSHRRTRHPSCNCASARSWTRAAQAHPRRASLDVAAPPLQEAPAFRASVLETARYLLLWASVLGLGRDARHVLPPAPDRLTNTRRRNRGLPMQQAQRSKAPTPSASFAFSWPRAPRILSAGASKE
jgi:hypothetical protein